MWQNFKKYLSPPIFADNAEKTKDARKSYPILLTLILTPIVYGLFIPIQPQGWLIRYGFVFATSFLALTSLILMRKGYVSFAKWFLVIAIWVISTVALLLSGGLSSPTRGIYVVLVVFAGFIFGKKGIVFSGSIAIFSNLVMVFLQNQQVLIPRDYPIEIYFTSATIFLIVVAFMFYLAVNEIDKTILKLQNQLEQKELAEKERASSENRFQHLIELSPMPILIADKDIDTEFINQQLTDLLGYTLEDIPDIESWFQKAYPDPEYCTKVSREWRKAVDALPESGGIIHSEYDVIDRWGNSHTIAFYANLIDEKMIVFMNDITEQRKMEQEIRQSEVLYRTLFENMQDGVLLLKDNKFVECNRMAEIIFGCEKYQLLGKSPYIFSPEKQPNGASSKQAALMYINKALAGEVQNFEWEHITRDGKKFSAQIYLSRANLPGGGYLLAQVRDISKQKQDQVIIKRGNQRMEILNTLDSVINTSFNLKMILNFFLNMITEQEEADAAVFLLYDPNLLQLNFEAGMGFYTGLEKTAQIRLGESLSGKAAATRQSLFIEHLLDYDLIAPMRHLVELEGFTSYYGIPMIVKGELKGVMEVFQRGQTPFGQDWLSYIETLANRAAIAIDNANMFNSLQKANLEMQVTYDTTLEGWVFLLSQRDDETEGHTRRVVDLTEKLARRVGVPENDLIHLLRGALLHDIGKIIVPDEILFKPGPLTEQEWVIMRKHPEAAYKAIKRIDYLHQAVDIPYCHHEWWDGSGYPRGLKGNQIPIAARIFSVIDVWDALSSDRPYRKAWPVEKILSYLEEQSGKQFDPHIVNTFLDMIKNDAGFGNLIREA